VRILRRDFSSSNRTDACEAEAEKHERAGLGNLLQRETFHQLLDACVTALAKCGRRLLPFTRALSHRRVDSSPLPPRTITALTDGGDNDP
jgi:hypothetical protein